MDIEKQQDIIDASYSIKFNLQETKNYMEQCIAINKFVANDKKYYPERYATSEFNVVQPSHESVYLPSN